MSLSSAARKLAAEVAEGEISLDAALATSTPSLEAELLSGEFAEAVDRARNLHEVANVDKLATRMLGLVQDVESGKLSEKSFARRARVVVAAARIVTSRRNRHA